MTVRADLGHLIWLISNKARQRLILHVKVKVSHYAVALQAGRLGKVERIYT